MELTQLAKEMLRLEEQAALIGRLLKGADEELLELVAGAWAPLRPKGYTAARWSAWWIEWLVECSERLPPAEAHVPAVPSRVDQGENWTRPEPLLTSHQHDDVIGCGI